MSTSYAGGTGYPPHEPVPSQNAGSYGALPDHPDTPMYPSSDGQNSSDQAYPTHNPQGSHETYPSSNGTVYAPYSVEAFNAHKQKDMSTNGIEKSNDPEVKRAFGLSRKWQKRLYWIVPLAILLIVIVVLFEVYKKDFQRWSRPLQDWLRERESWSWIIPVAILIILSIPPLFGHEIVQLIIGLAYPLGVAIGIASAGAILGEAVCFVLFKYGFSGYVMRKCERELKWAATARVASEAGFWGVMIIRYSIVPPHLANPIFATTGMTFWLYMVSVILSLPKSLVFVALGSPNNEGKTGAKVGKVIAIGVLCLVTLAGTWWIRKRINRAIAEIEAERLAAKGSLPNETNEVDESTLRPSQAQQYGYGYGAQNEASEAQFPPPPPPPPLPARR